MIFSEDEQGAFAFLGEVALNIAGVAITYAATKAIGKFRYDSNALKKIKEAKTVAISDLRSLLNESEEKLVLVRGCVELKPTNSLSVKPDVLVHWGSRNAGVILQKIYAYNQFRKSGMPEYYTATTSMSTVPFVLYGNETPCSSYLDVNLEGSTQPIPLQTIFKQLSGVKLLDNFLPLDGLIEEKMLLLGKDITAVGICSLQEGNPQIRANPEIHYFLSDMTKSEMVDDIQEKMLDSKFYAVVLGYMSVCLLGYIFIRNRRLWKKWRQQPKNGGGIAATIPFVTFLVGLWYNCYSSGVGIDNNETM